MTPQLKFLVGKPFSHAVLAKALHLIRNGKITKITENVYCASSIHFPPRSYMIEKISGDLWTCNCWGFRDRKICAHVVAVMMLQSKLDQTQIEKVVRH